MSVFLLMDSIIDKITTSIRNFWWANSIKQPIPWVSWKKYLYPKIKGGLDFRNLKAFNRAPLAKQAWCILMEPDLVDTTIKAKYFPHYSFLLAPSLHLSGASYMWRSIYEGIKLLNSRIFWKVGNRQSIEIWTDPWIPRPYSFKPLTYHRTQEESLRVADFILQHSRMWDIAKLATIFNGQEANIVTSIRLC